MRGVVAIEAARGSRRHTGAVVIALAMTAWLVGPIAPVDAAPLVAEAAPGVTVDWMRGVVIARGVGPADRNAPTPAIARVSARRAAIEQARARLRAAVALLPAAGGALGQIAPAARLAAEVERGAIVDEQLGTDGSVRLSVRVGIEALRQAAAGPRPAPADEAAAAAWIVDAQAHAVTPQVGLALAKGNARWLGPVRYATAVPDGAQPARAIGVGAAQLEVEALPPAGVAVVVVVRPEP